ncbi:MAG TPA: arginase family protein [Candidatus Limnocylindria bacterium]|nr:arginase family protein [Candidatus Limnocylindria bacterium]
MAPKPVHLLEAGVVTEQRFMGVAEAPAALGPAFVERLSPAKRVRVPFNPRDRWLTAAREACILLSDAVATSLKAGAQVGILGGECTLVAGSLSGALAVEPELVLVYFDAHGDFNTVATTPSHFVGGMCLAHVCGKQVAPLLWPGVKKIAEDRTYLVGARDLDPGEVGNLSRSKVHRIAFDRDEIDAPSLLAAVRRKPVWVHVDLDIVDPRELAAVAVPADGGPSLKALSEILASVASVADVRGIEICGYDARKDPGAQLPGVLAEAFAGVFG